MNIHNYDEFEDEEETECEEDVRERCLRHCPDLYAHLLGMEKLAEPFFLGILPDEDMDDIRPF